MDSPSQLSNQFARRLSLVLRACELFNVFVRTTTDTGISEIMHSVGRAVDDLAYELRWRQRQVPPSPWTGP